jgi:hypothetical protein
MIFNARARETPRRWLSRSIAAVFAIGVVGLLLLSTTGPSSALGSKGSPFPGSRHAGSTTALAAPHPASHVAPSLPHSFGPPNSGRGTFFVNSPIAFPATGAPPIFGTPQNNSNDPSLNLTTNGVLAVAYTVWTNATACANVTPYAQTEIGFSSSTNGGATWTTPTYLSNADCTHANQYVNAWQPSLTSLSNGTLVLAYIQLNMTPFSSPMPYTNFGQYGYWSVAFARLVLTESYDNGTTWTAPVTLNASSNPTLTAQNWLPERPWITAFGQTIYVSWMNYSQAPYGVYPSTTQGSSQVHLLVSVTGGQTWGTRIDLPDVAAGGAQQGINPFVLTGATGTLYLAYTTNITWQYSYNCTKSCVYYVFTANILVGSSTNNGTTFALHNATRGAVAASAGWGANEGFLYPAPQLAINPVNGQLYLAYTGGQPFSTCTPYCYSTVEPNAFVTNSSNGGVTWATPHYISSALLDRTGFNAYNVAITTTSDGILQLETTWLPVNDPAVCQATYNCPQFQLYLNSTDNGTTFSSPITIWTNSTDWPYMPDGEYDTMVSAGTNVFLSWSHEWCATSFCYYPSASGSSQVTVSTLYRGVGVTLTYLETGLTPGTPWTIDVGGNPRAGNAPTALSVSGVPPSTAVNWTVGNIAAGYGIRYGSTPSIPPPASFTASSTIYENFSEQVLVNVTSNPWIPSCAVSTVQFCWDSPYSIRINYNITPAPAPNWVPLGSTLGEAVTLNPIYGACTFCYLTFENLSFLSWTGTGAGSVNSSTPFINITANGPVNESANFRVVSSCIDYSYNTPPLQCTTENATLMFHESGLPASTKWTVSAWGYGNGTATNSSTTPWLGITSNVTVGITSYAVWTIPDGVTGKYWVGTSTPQSPVELPGVRIVSENFTAVLPTTADFSTTFSAVGLPTATPWSLTLNAAQYGVQSANWTVSLAGGSQSVAASPVYLTGGTSYYPSLITFEPFTVGGAWQNFSTFPASVTLDGPAIVWVTYSPEYWVTVTNSTGGTVTPGSQWVHSSGFVQLNETPSSGYYFVGWSGSGVGQVTTATPNPKVIPGGPVTELATFSLNPPPRWTVRIAVVGLPAGVSLTVGLGSTNFTGGASYVAAGLLSGPYRISLPIAYENSSQLTRFVPTVLNTSFPYVSPGVLNVSSNGWLNLTVATEYLVTLASTAGGAISPGPGSSWALAGATIPVTATPDVGYYLAGWNASGSGSIGGSALTISPTANAPIWETAQFLPKPTHAPAVYSLTVTESGLPNGANWSISLGTGGAGSATTTLTIGGLNGTYTLIVPTVYSAAGTTRYLPTNASWSQGVLSNTSITVTFTTQYLLTVTGSNGGNASSGGWEAKGATVPLTATASGSNWQFVNWTGSGAGSASGTASAISVTMNGPVVETAVFAPVYPPATTSGSSTTGQTTALGLLIAMLAAGLVIGLLIARRRPPTAVQSWNSTPPTSDEPAASDGGPPPETDPSGAAGGAPDGDAAGSRPIYDEGPG